MIFKTVLTTLFLTLCLGIDAQANESPKQASIFALQPFERAICCIKYYEGIHRKKDYPYVGYGHKLRPGEHYSSNMSLREADALLRKDLKELFSSNTEKTPSYSLHWHIMLGLIGFLEAKTNTPKAHF